MKQQLYFRLELKPYPYPDGYGSEANTWGQISVIVSGDVERVLLVWEWNFDVLVEWFDTNRNALLSEELSICGSNPLPGESLAAALNRLRSRDFPNEDEEEYQWYDGLFNYSEKHCLWFALRGANIPDIIIGLNHSVGEISQSDEQEEWAYQFDMPTFCEDLEKELNIVREKIR